MKNFILKLKGALTICTLMLSTMLLSSCIGEEKEKLIFGTSADYPPFEYIVDGEIVGFEIELANKISELIGREIEFKDMSFNSIMPAIDGGVVDAGMSTITVTEERAENYDFTIPFYKERLAIVFKKDTPIKSAEEFVGKKIVAQLGTTMEIWLKNNAPGGTIVSTLDGNLEAIEALKAGHFDGVFIDAVQAISFAKVNPELGCALIAESDNHYAIALKKGSELKAELDEAIQKLIDDGTLAALIKTHLGK